MKQFRYLGVATILMSLVSCDYKTIADAEYPEQMIYLSGAASSEVYVIESIPQHTSNTPTPGTAFQFIVNKENSLFVIPLSVYRSGVRNDGDIRAKITYDNEIVRQLIDEGKLGSDVQQLPEVMMSGPNEVTIPDGEDYRSFDVSVDMEFLEDRAPDGKFAFGVVLSDGTATINEKFARQTVVIDTKLMAPTSSFGYNVDGSKWSLVHFANTSSSIVSSHWSFGDGTESYELNPSHQYEGEGTYTVTLETEGITGTKEISSMEIQLIDIKEISKKDWAIESASTEEPSEDNGTGNGYAAAAIDDNVATYWHSRWNPSNDPHPHSFVVDMGAEHTISYFTCVRRQGDNRGQTKCKIYLSKDNVEWEDCGIFEINPDTDAPQMLTLKGLKRARYFKYESIESRQGFSFLAEISAFGSM